MISCHKNSSAFKFLSIADLWNMSLVKAVESRDTWGGQKGLSVFVAKNMENLMWEHWAFDQISWCPTPLRSGTKSCSSLQIERQAGNGLGVGVSCS